MRFPRTLARLACVALIACALLAPAAPVDAARPLGATRALRQSDDEAIIDVHFVRKVGSPDFLKDSIFACVASGEVTCQDCG